MYEIWGPHQLTKLEKAILEKISIRENCKKLSQQISNIVSLERSYSSAGSLTKFLIKNPDKIDVKSRIINGCKIESIEIENGGTSLLWVENGLISTLEISVYGNNFNPKVLNFVLQDN